MKLARLYQPRSPRFWLLILLNTLSAAISWLLQTRPMALAPTLVLAFFALGNFLLGIKLAVQLMRESAEAECARK